MTSRIGLVGGIGLLLVVARAEAAEPPSVPMQGEPAPAPAENASSHPGSLAPTAAEPEATQPPSSAPLGAASPSPAPVPVPAAVPAARPALPEPQHSGASSRDSALLADDGPLGDNQRYFSALVGVRSVVVVDSSYEPFATRNVLPLFSLGASAVVAAQGPLSLALGAGWEIGGSRADVRSAQTDILAQRFSLTPEGRYHLSRRIYLLGRVGLGAGYLRATIEDLAAGDDRSADGFSLTMDPGVGLGVQLTSTRSSHSSKPRLWVTADAGYLYDTGVALRFGSDGSDIPARSALIDLGKLSLSGPYGRLAGILAF